MFAKRLQDLRKQAGYSRADLAKMIGLSISSISNYENNIRKPDNDEIWRKIASIFGVSVDYLMGEELENLSSQEIHLLKKKGLIPQDYAKKFSSRPEVLASDISSKTPIPITKQKEDFLSYDNIYPIEMKKFPLLGEVACGKPIFSPEDADAYVVANSDIKADFALQARGDSMINARIYDGDMVFIHEQPVVENGEIAAVAIDNEVTLKHVYYYPEQGKLILTPENPMYEPMVYIGEELNSIRILGKAVAFMSNI